MKFVLLVEGDTEKLAARDFMQRWLNPQLKKNVGIQVVRFQGYSELLRKIVQKTHAHLDGPRNEDIIAVIGLIDLYGPHFYPSHARTADERYEWGVQHIEKEVDRDRFRMFFAVHEFEAWLLSQPTIFPRTSSPLCPAESPNPKKSTSMSHLQSCSTGSTRHERNAPTKRQRTAKTYLQSWIQQSPCRNAHG